MILGTRGSELALRQTEMVMAALREAHPSLEVTKKIISTIGDKRTDLRFSHEYVTPMADALFRQGFGEDARVAEPERHRRARLDRNPPERGGRIGAQLAAREQGRRDPRIRAAAARRGRSGRCRRRRAGGPTG